MISRRRSSKEIREEVILINIQRPSDKELKNLVRLINEDTESDVSESSHDG